MHFLITAGPTREPLDPVRYLSNRSSGKMGYAVAQAAVEAGHEVTLISGPVSLQAPAGCRLVKVETAAEMFSAAEQHIAQADVAILCAAVADYTPAAPAREKIKKSGSTWTLELVPTRDILGSMRGEMNFQGVLVGFAAETEHLEQNALAKLQKKQCDLIVANDVSGTGTGFDAEDNEATLYFRNRPALHFPRAAKRLLAEKLVGICVELAESSRP